TGNDIIHAGGGNDILDAGTGSNQLYGDAGDDIIKVASGSAGNTMVGGTGNDTLTGGYGADTYLFDLGDGQDTITDNDPTTAGKDTLRFGAGILASDIHARRVDSDLVFMHSNGTDQVMVKSWFDRASSNAEVNVPNIIERVEFADGTFWTWSGMTTTGVDQLGSAGDDTLLGWTGNDIIHAGGGNDILDGGTGSNQLYGDAGDDTIKVASGSAGNTLAGGTGNDTLTGGSGADTYLFDLGDGQDTITDNDPTTAGKDTLRFGAGILAGDILACKVGSDVVFMHRNGLDQVTVKGWFDGTTASAGLSAPNIVERVEFDDGTVWTWADISAKGLSQLGTTTSETLVGWSGNDIIHAGGGNDTLEGGAGSNQLYGDAGDDVIKVASDSTGNILAGGTGNDTLTGGYGADTYLFNLGDGQDTITDNDPTTIGKDTLRFGAGILASDIHARRVDSDLVFMHSNG
ncbi:calcium-binding protein, partial [Pseudomonas sp. UMAB-40]|uniref:calcium-binding protein n=1 Tax=Pseudomonas sp. UMAB-40 TaxID=1365407 RepID=UPI0027D7B678